MWAVVPIKQFSVAKMRLAAILDETQRVQLARAMFRDVLRALDRCDAIHGIVVVSREPDARPIAAEFGAQFVVEQGHELSLAVTQGGRHVMAAGGTAMLCLHGDVPLVTAAEITELVAAQGDRRGLTLVADRDGTGTNGLAVSPVDLMTFSYGRDSFEAHIETARILGVGVRSLKLEGLSLDIDTSEDLHTLMGYERETETLEFLRSVDVVSRLPPRHNVGQAVIG